MPAPVLQFKRGNAGVAGTVPALRPGEPAISLNNFDFFIGIDTSVTNNKFFGSHRYWEREDGTNSLKLKLVSNNGSESVNLRAPTGLGATVNYTLPATPTDTFLLTTNGSGVLSWTNSIPGGSFTGITTFTDTTDNTLGNENTGSVQLDGGMGIAKNLTVKQNLHVGGYSEFVGVVTFKGGTINLGDADTDDIVFGGEIKSNVVPTDDATYDIGIGGKRWRNAIFSGVGTFATGAVVDAVQIGITAAGEIDTSSGALTLDSASGQTIIDDNLSVTGISTIGNFTITPVGSGATVGNSGIVTYHGDGSQLTGLIANTIQNIDTNQIYYPLLSPSTSGTISSISVSSNSIVFNPGPNNLGIGSTVPRANLDVLGTVLVSGASTFSSALTVNGTLTASSTLTLSGSATGTHVFGSNQTSGTLIFGGTSGTGAITLGRATTSQTTNIQAGASGIGTTKTINLGTGGLSGSNTQINIGPTAGVGTVVINSGTNLGIGSAIPTTALDVVGDVKSTGDIAVNGGDVTTTATTFNLINGTATNVNFAGAATALVMSAATGITTVSNNLTVGGDVRVNGNDIQASDGNTNITLTSNTLTTFAGDIRVNGNDIQASDGNTNITMTSNTLTEVKGDLKVTGNDIQSSTGVVAITLADNDVTVADDLTVQGNLYVNGSTTQVNTTALTVEDRTIDLGIVNGAAPASTTTWDLGILFNYNSSGAKKSAVVWEHADTRFKFASVLGADTDGTDVNTPQLTVTTFAPIEIGSLWVTDCAGTSQVISCTGTTRNLENITVDAGTF